MAPRGTVPAETVNRADMLKHTFDWLQAPPLTNAVENMPVIPSLSY